MSLAYTFSDSYTSASVQALSQMADDSLFPHEVSRQANDGNQKNDEVEHGVGP